MLLYPNRLFAATLLSLALQAFGFAAPAAEPSRLALENFPDHRVRMVWTNIGERYVLEDTPPGHWNQIARAIANHEKLRLHEKARLLALVNVALADAGVVSWEAKYHFNFWRPVTAIRRAGEDENSETIPDPQWEPLVVTPAFPEYVSGHSTFSGAAGEVIREFFGRDNIRFNIGSDSVPRTLRTYDSLSEAVEEIGRSRILGGIHYSSSDRAGRTAGRAVAQYICSRLLPAPHPDHVQAQELSRPMEFVRIGLNERGWSVLSLPLAHELSGSHKRESYGPKLESARNFFMSLLPEWHCARRGFDARGIGESGSGQASLAAHASRHALKTFAAVLVWLQLHRSIESKYS